MDLTSFGIKGVEKKEELNEVNDKNLDIDFDKIKSDYKNIEEERFLPWFMKYKVEKLENLIETTEIKKIKKFFESWKKKGSQKDTKEAQKIRSKGLLLVGMPGSGKTTTLTLFGNSYGYEIFELNASDSRNKKGIVASVGDVIKQKSLFGAEKLILVDEADGVSGTNDRGGLAEIVKIFKNSTYPFVFSANDKESDKIKAIKKICTTVDFESHSFELLIGIAENILEKEGVEYDEEKLGEFVEKRNTADIRGFINDLQSSVFDGVFDPKIELEIRGYKNKINNVLDKIFYSFPEDSLKSTYNSDVNIDDLFLYLEENVPTKYQGNALNFAFNEISKADVFRGRIRKWQYWRYLVYVNFYLSFGVSESKGLNNIPKSSIYKKNGRILKKWIYNNKVGDLNPRTKIQKQKDDPQKFIERLANYYKCSVSKCRKENLPFFVESFRHNTEFRNNIIEQLEITQSTQKMLDEL